MRNRINRAGPRDFSELKATVGILPRKGSRDWVGVGTKGLQVQRGFWESKIVVFLWRNEMNLCCAGRYREIGTRPRLWSGTPLCRPRLL